ncbi:MAG: SRPBCC family protein [Sciscionella sp.]
MADESTQSIVIDATPAQIMDVIADFPSYPQWANAIKQTEVLESFDDGLPKQVRLTIDQGPVKDQYTLRYEWAADGMSVRWSLVRGQMQKAQNGSYTLRPQGESTEVTYRLSVQLVIPMIGLLRRKAEKVIMDTALKELKRQVENTS